MTLTPSIQPKTQDASEFGLFAPTEIRPDAPFESKPMSPRSKEKFDALLTGSTQDAAKPMPKPAASAAVPKAKPVGFRFQDPPAQNEAPPKTSGMSEPKSNNSNSYTQSPSDRQAQKAGPNLPTARKIDNQLAKIDSQPAKIDNQPAKMLNSDRSMPMSDGLNPESGQIQDFNAQSPISESYDQESDSGPDIKTQADANLLMYGLPFATLNPPMPIIERSVNEPVSLNEGPSLVQAAPVTALLIGRLDQLKPQQIPGLVSKTPLVQQSLATPNLDEVLDQPLTIAQVFDALNIDNSAKQLAVKMGIDLSAITTPREFLNLNGIDTQIVATELNLLRANIPLEGLKPYLQRAQAIQTAQPQTRLSETPLVIPQSKQVPSPQDSIPQSLLIDSAPPSDPIVNTMALPIATGTIVRQTKLDYDPTKTPIDLDDPKQSLQNQSDDLWSQTDIPVSRLADLTNPLPENTKNSVATALALPLTANIPQLTSIDPFAALGDEMDSDSITMEFAAPGQSQVIQYEEFTAPQAQVIESTQPASMSSSVHELISAMKANLTKPATERAPTPRVVTRPTEMRDNPQTILPLIPLAAAITPEAINSRETRPDSLATKIAELNLEPIKSDSPSMMPSNNTQTNSNSQDNSGSFSSNQFSDPRLSMTTPQNGSSRFLELKTALGVAPQPIINRHELVQHILENSQTMLRSGGGSMRLSVDTKEMGKIDLAVNVQDHKLDLRILAPNERVRDAMMVELPKMREMLQSQNLQLSAVEVGVAGKGYQHQQQTSQQQSHQFDRNEALLPEYLRNNQSTQSNWLKAARRPTQSYRHDGRIQVLA